MISIETLRKHLSTTTPVRRSLDSGLRALDLLLGEEGLLSGQAFEWLGSASCGKTGVLRELVRGVRRRGIAVAWVDAGAELMAADWVDDSPGRLWMLRPPQRHDALFCVEAVLRSQSFGLVILDGAPMLRGNIGVRLQRLTRQSGSILVMIRSPEQSASTGRIHGRFQFEGRVQPSADPVSARGPLTWSIRAMRGRGGAPTVQGTLHLVESLPGRTTAAPLTADRPATRAASGGRYGR